MVKADGHNTSLMSQVSLVHASDSVRTVIGGPQRPHSVMKSSSSGLATTSSSSMTVPSQQQPSTSGGSSGGVPFISAATTLQRMSKPPVRVVAQPPHQNMYHQQQQHYQQQQQILSRPHVIPTMQVQPMAGRSNMEYGTNGKQRIISNGIHNDQSDYGSVKQNSQDMMQKVRAIRRQVADEETELRRLRELEHETSMMREKNAGREKELAQEFSKLNEEQTALRNATLRVQSLTRHLEEMYKRRQTAAAAALVEQRKMQQQLNSSRPTSSAAVVNNNPEVVRPRASVEPFQVVVPAIQKNGGEMLEKMEKEGDFVDGFDVSKIPSEPLYQAPSPKNEVKISPSPPKDPHPNFEASPVVVVERPTSFADSLDESRLKNGKTDAISLRSDSLKAAKRRSWAASEGTSMSEAEMIHRLLDDQRRGRTHFIPQLPTPQEEQVEEAQAQPAQVESEFSKISSEPEKELQEIQEQSSDTTTEEECSVKSDDEQMVEMDVEKHKVVVKGILRRPNEKMNKGRIEFDPLALLLDAALEGELDLVKSSASRLNDVSQANDEGITALHNAICAGHYEIVKFLIESDADVNAQDSDGWTPLHCAASCNNLPMVRQLVEGGGCVLASTLSDMETPVEKCEEEEDGYDGCLKYLVAAHNSTGSLNGGKVYAAYPYDAEFEDELSFEAGDDLVVISKDDVDKHWWTCKKSNGETGLVPRTYLALYPALKFRKNLNFVMFDLPVESNNNFE